jgi:hypothetical protein
MNFLETENTNNKKKGAIFKTSQQKTQIMKAKYFCILAYKLKTDYKCLSHRHGVFPTTRPSTGGLINLVQQRGLGCKLFSS